MEFVLVARAVMRLSATIIGAGIVALSTTMNVLGLLGIVTIFLVTGLTNASIKILMKFSAASYSYADVMNATFGDVGRISLQLCVVIHVLATFILDIITIRELFFKMTANGVVCGVWGRWLEEHEVLCGTALAFLFAASASMDSLRTNCFAVLLAIISLGITAANTFYKLVNVTLPMPRLLPDVTDFNFVQGLFNVITALVTAFICHFNVHTIRNELQDPVLMRRAVDIALNLCRNTYLIASFSVFILSREFGLSYFINDFVCIIFALHFVFVFPNRLEVLHLNLDALFTAAWYNLNLDHNGRFAIIGVALFAIVCAMMNYITWNVFQIIRVTSAAFLGYIFPAMIALRDIHGIATLKDRVSSVLMIGFAVFGILATIYIA